MPLQRHDTSPVPRPSGLVPPAAELTGITELRLHGVGGTTPEDLLADAAPQHVSGDRIAGFYRTADLPDRHVEAYSWGGMTSRSGARVLWLLLFPFALANVAGWMCSRRTQERPVLFRLHRAAVRWACLGLTLNLLLIAALTGMELLGYQCGGQAGCADDAWPVRLLHHPLLADHPARRILAGTLVPLAVLVLLAVLALRTISRYEATSPRLPGSGAAGSVSPGADRPAGAEDGVGARRSRGAARCGVGLADPGFWDGQRSALEQGYLHIAAGLAFVALALGHTVRESARLAGVPPQAPVPARVASALAVLVLVGVLVFVAVERCPAAVPVVLLGSAGGAVCCAGWFAAVQPAYQQSFGYLPGMRAVAGLTLGGVLGTLLLVLAAVVPGGWRRGTFVAFGPFVAITLSVFALNVVLVSLMTRVAAVTAEVSTRVHLPDGPPDRPELYVYPVVGRLVHYLTLLPLALILLFAAYELVGYWRAGADRAERDRIRAWYREHSPRPEAEARWQRSTVADADRERQRIARLWDAMLGRGWEARLARARRVARMPRDVDKLLTAIAAVGAVLVVVLQVRYWVFDKLPWGTQWTLTLGSYLAAGIPFAIILVLRKGWRDLHSRRRIGVLWDVLTFWPRAYHPLAPPSYAERAVPELQQRLWRIHDSGGRVVLAAHSQGTVLAAAALLQRENRPADDVVALVTFGSPLSTLYGWAFPGYFGERVLRRLAPTGGAPGVALHAWRNFYYRTDYIGGRVFGPGRGPAGVDVELPDPVSNWYIHGQPAPTAARHSGYWVDPAVWLAVDDLAEAVAAVRRVPRQSRAALHKEA
ncbi:hypothetical protein [Plantactinospora endophytica]|uniref:Integral membrane protein n=1 Tax=Plantactinospora endophytica TaxID=673535 RepID=A0ABQ4DUN8_9ACTN|nr:hypothetical protein [Plantactinospora endophytica]GIG86155.1 hypothetical protein Pen02_10910 [Plantactinospora endophytica]